jgi:hypothetical protein
LRDQFMALVKVIEHMKRNARDDAERSPKVAKQAAAAGLTMAFGRARQKHWE